MPYKDPEAQKAAQAKWYQENRALVRERSKAWRDANPEKKRAADAVWKEANRDLQRAYQSKYWASHPELRAAKLKSWAEKWKEKRRSWPPELKRAIKTLSKLKEMIHERH